MADRYWVGGTASWDATASNKWALTSGGQGGQAVPTSVDDVFFDAASGSVTVTVASTAACRNLSFTSGAGNFTGTFAGTAAIGISGNLTLAAGMGRTYTGTISFASTTTQTITSNGVALDSPIAFTGVGGNWTIADDFVTGSTRTTALTNGTITLAAGKKLSTGLFSADNNNVRAITFGAGSYFDITGTANAGSINAWFVQNLTNMTYTGSPDVRLTGNSTANTRSISNGGTGGATEAKAVSFTISAGSDIITNTANNAIKDLIFTSFTGSVANVPVNLYGNFTLSSGMTFSQTNFVIMVATSGTQTITTNGVTVDCPFRVNSPGATTVLADNFTQGSTRAFSILGGTLNVNGKILTVGTFSSSTTASRTLAFGTSGTINVVGSGASAWSAANGTLTMTGTGIISMTSASAKTFAGGGFNYAATLDQGGAGTLTISGNNTFQNITNTYGSTGAATITFTASSTQTVSQFTASGTSGKLLTLNSSSAGTRFNLSDASGFVSVSFCSISDSNATGGAIWNASTANGNVNSGNNIGWEFTSVYYWVGGSGTWNNTSKTNWSSSSGGAGGFGPPVSVDTINFDSNSGTGICTTAATASGAAITLNSATLGLTLGAEFTMSGAFTLTQGTLNLSGFKLSCLNFASTGVSSRSISFGTSGNITVSGSGATAWNASGSGLTTTGTTSTISMISASAKTFAGGGFNYAASLDQGGAGTLTISGNNTFQNITNTYGATGATAITFTAGTTQTVSAFTASGTIGKLLTLNSSSAGTRFNLSDPSGSVNVSFCSIKDSNATGGARWNSYLSNGNINAGNNLGWDFSQRGGLSPVPGLSGANGLSLGVGLVGNL